MRGLCEPGQPQQSIRLPGRQLAAARNAIRRSPGAAQPIGGEICEERGVSHPPTCRCLRLLFDAYHAVLSYPGLGCMRYRTPGFRQLVVRRPRWSYLSPLHDGRCLQGPKTWDTVTEAECAVGRRICWLGWPWSHRRDVDERPPTWGGHRVAWKLERIRSCTALEHRQRT